MGDDRDSRRTSCRRADHRACRRRQLLPHASPGTSGLADALRRGHTGPGPGDRIGRRPDAVSTVRKTQEVARVKIGIIGAGRIGGGLARQLAGAGHQVLLSFSRDRAALDELAAQIGSSASTGSPPDAVAFGEVVMISVPWSVLPLALEQAGPLDGKIVIDTTNQFGGPPLPPGGPAAAGNPPWPAGRPSSVPPGGAPPPPPPPQYHS